MQHNKQYNMKVPLNSFHLNLPLEKQEKSGVIFILIASEIVTGDNITFCLLFHHQ